MIEPRLDFEFIAGSLPIDFVNTVTWARTGLRNERFREFDDLVDWAREARLVSARTAVALRKEALRHPQAAERELRRALSVRDSIQRMLSPLSRGRSINAAEVQAFNSLLTRATRGLAVASEKGVLRWHIESARAPLSSIVSEVLWKAAQFLTSPEPKMLRACGNRDCGWMFLDRSRRGNRRWCAMNECGSRAKARRYYRRKRQLLGSTRKQRRR